MDEIFHAKLLSSIYFGISGVSDGRDMYDIESLSVPFSSCCRCLPKTELKPKVGVPMNCEAQVPLLLSV